MIRISKPTIALLLLSLVVHFICINHTIRRFQREAAELARHERTADRPLEPSP